MSDSVSSLNYRRVPQCAGGHAKHLALLAVVAFLPSIASYVYLRLELDHLRRQAGRTSILNGTPQDAVFDSMNGMALLAEACLELILTAITIALVLTAQWRRSSLWMILIYGAGLAFGFGFYLLLGLASSA